MKLLLEAGTSSLVLWVEYVQKLMVMLDATDVRMLAITIHECCVAGFVLRLCNMDGEWNSTIDITNCSSANFIDLERTAVSA